MRKRLMTLFLATALIVMAAVPAWACTPPLNVGNIWGDLTPLDEIEYEPSDEVKDACDNAAKKWLEEHPIDIKIETETTETEIQKTEMESESEVQECTYRPWLGFRWLKAKWFNFSR